MKKKSLLLRLRTNGTYYIIGALLLLAGIPLYQLFVLIPAGYDSALADARTAHVTVYLAWIGSHSIPFIIYRALLVIAFVLLISFPFTLFRIIVAQEIMGQQENTEAGDDQTELADDALAATTEENQGEQEESTSADDMPAHAWRGKGFVIIAAWSGFFGLIAYILGTVASTFYLLFTSHGLPATATPSNFATLSTSLSLIANTAGVGLLALAMLFFGAVIARRGLSLWPGIWLALGYVALAVAALFSGSAVAAAVAPVASQATLSTPATLLFALWVLWFGVMLARLKPE
ncbi:MAG: hypothetical protein JO202_19875 [Ktedonobacteraceae bacterium]|nr:hypothetical protein [Ktedonobacteraceae bacterium]